MVDGEKPGLGVDSRDEGKLRPTGRNDMLFVQKMTQMDERE